MTPQNERRENKRHNIHSPMIFKIFHSAEDCKGVELNHSNDGVAFKSRVCLKPGTIIHIRRESSPTNKDSRACAGYRMNTLATVLWCNKDETEGEAYFVGAKYFEYGIGY